VDALEEPIKVAGELVCARPSVGAVLVTPAHSSVTDVLRHADGAMYAAKRAGGNRFVVHDPSEGVSTSSTSGRG
ncbi:MAG: diguanylate cyclase domain-containing protein, partial [Nocardioidaceae bacterium]